MYSWLFAKCHTMFVESSYRVRSTGIFKVRLGLMVLSTDKHEENVSIMRHWREYGENISCQMTNTCFPSLSLWRWTTPPWLENQSHRLARQSSHTTIHWRPATSVSFPPTASRVSRLHLDKTVSYHPGMDVFSPPPSPTPLVAIWRLTSFGIVPHS